MAFAIPLAIAIGTSAGAIAIAGAAMVAVGGLTGSKSLMKIGGLISLGSAFASLATTGTALAGEVATEGAGAFGGDIAGTASAAEGGVAADALLNGATAAPTSIAESVVQGVDASQTVIDGGGVPGPQGELAGSPVETAMAAPQAQSPATAALSAPAGGGGGVYGGEIAGTSAAVEGGPPGLIDSIMNPARAWWNSQGDLTKASIVRAGGDFIAGGLKRDANGEYVDFQREEAARRTANANNIGQISVNHAPNANANLYPGGRYVAPKVGIINSQMQS